MEVLVNVLLLATVVAVGVMAGVYFTFSAFVMRSLDMIEKPAGMMAMQTINREILKSAFLPLFFLSSAACAVFVVIAILDLSEGGALPMLAGAMAYLGGMFLVTVLANVPLNDQLEATPAHGAEGEPMWRRYMQRWVAWNHVRTVSCFVATALLAAALAMRV